jgi:hypothetical protein
VVAVRSIARWTPQERTRFWNDLIVSIFVHTDLVVPLEQSLPAQVAPSRPPVQQCSLEHFESALPTKPLAPRL